MPSSFLPFQQCRAGRAGSTGQGRAGQEQPREGPVGATAPALQGSGVRADVETFFFGREKVFRYRVRGAVQSRAGVLVGFSRSVARGLGAAHPQ